MDKNLKKLNGSMIAAIVLSVLLIMSLTAGATLAWFSSRDAGTRNLTMGEAVVVTISDADPDKTYRQGEGTLPMVLPVDEATNGLLPGMMVNPNIKVQLQKSNTNAILRARFVTTVEYPDKYKDAAYDDETKYPNKTGYTIGADGKVTAPGRVLDETVFPNDHVYSAVINYDYYNTQGQKIDAAGNVITADEHSVTVNLHRVKVRNAIVAALGKDFEIGGQTVGITAENAAAMEIRQRGIDLTDAINIVLSGERGKGIDLNTGEIVDNPDFGIKYARRIADGWAYRQADKAWYYLGSATNGYVLQNQTGIDETVTATIIANDINGYTKLPGSGSKPDTYRPDYAPLTATPDKLDDSRNYLGTKNAEGVVAAEDNETSVLKTASMASIDLKQGNISIDFLTKKFSLPTFINNDYAKAKVTFTFTAEAIQDNLVDVKQEGLGNSERVPNNLVNSILVFNNGFLATKVAGLADLEATGTFFNVVPGAPLQTAEEVTAGAGACAKAPNKGYGTKDDGTGVNIADYTVTDAAYVLGTASSLGVQPLSGAKVTITP